MSPLHAVVAFILLERLVELGVAARNTRRLLAKGGYEVGARHYPLFILLHGGWLAALVLMVDPATPPNLPLLGAFLLLQPVRGWIIASLGARWRRAGGPEIPGLLEESPEGFQVPTV